MLAIIDMAMQLWTGGVEILNFTAIFCADDR